MMTTWLINRSQVKMPGESSTRKFKLPLDECGDYLNSPIENLVELDVLSEARATRGGRGGRGGRAGGCSLARSRSAPSPATKRDAARVAQLVVDAPEVATRDVALSEALETAISQAARRRVRRRPEP